MLQILKREDNVGYRAVIDALGLESSEDIRISEAVNGEEVSGYVVYKFDNDKIIIYDVVYGTDIMLCDGLIRSVLFLAAMIGIEKAVFEVKFTDDLTKLGFISEGVNVLEPISEKLGGCENCKK